MTKRSHSRKSQRGGTIILVTLLLPLLMIPLVGLAIDGTRLYIVQSKLSEAVDGAALGAGRLLGTNANTTEIAGEFLHANFPTGYWNTNSLTPNITYTNNLGVQTITVNASVVLPLTFAKVFRQNASLVSAKAVATRRVTRVMIVLDRSASMDNTDPTTGANVFTSMKAGAQWFASQFTPGYDELGLVMYNGTAVVAYPTTRPWNPSTSASGGPDKTFATDPVSQTGPIFDQLRNMAVGGYTGTGEAMALAYIEMQKAHNRDLAAYGTDNTLNTIVLFTDGVPNAIPTYVNDPSQNLLKPFGANSNTESLCLFNPANGLPASQLRGYLTASPPTPGSPSWSTSRGAMRLAQFDSSHTLSWWVGSNGADDFTPGAPTTAYAGCASLSTGKLKDLAKLPDTDIYGFSTTGMGYTNSVMYDGTRTWTPNTQSYDPTDPTDGYNVGAAAWNLTDNIGKAIRTQNAMNQIQIFTIGYSGNAGTDVGLLQRLANAPNSSSFVASEPIGKFYLVNSTSQLIGAFDAIASSLLRLAQ